MNHDSHHTVRIFFELIRIKYPIGWILLVLPALWMIVIEGQGQIDYLLTFKFIVGAFFARSAGCIINDCWDKEIDKKITRTAHRPLADGRISVETALVLLIPLFCSILIIALSLNNAIWYLAPLVAILIILYPLVKRISFYPQYFLGITFASSVLFANLAITGGINQQAMLLYLLTVVWIVIYDTQYAVSDLEQDIEAQVKSFAVRIKDNLHAIIFMLEAVLIFGWLLFLNGLMISVFYKILIIVTMVIFFGYQHFLLLPCYSRLAMRCFYSHGWLGFFILVELMLGFNYA